LCDIMDNLSQWCFQLSRSIYDSEIFNKPSDWFKVWIYILWKVNFKDNWLPRWSAYFKYERIERDCKVKYNIVTKICKYLKEKNQIEVKKATHGCIINVINYSLYQWVNNYKSKTQATQGQDTGNTGVDNIYNNDKKKKNDKEWEEYKYNNIYIPSEIISFFDKQKENMISIASQINKDKYYIAKQSIEYEKLKKEVLAIWDPETLCPAILHFTCNDNFWKKNIWSISKLIKNNSEWVKYWIVMLEKMKQSQTWKDWKTKRRIF